MSLSFVPSGIDLAPEAPDPLLARLRKASAKLWPWAEDGSLRLAYVLLLALVLLYVRKPDAFHRPQFWAEDGKIFFLDARELGLEAFTESYRGAHYLFHRLVAHAGTYVSVRSAPKFYNGAALLAILAVVAYIRCRDLPIRHKTLLILALLACPHSGEVFLNLTNVHWVLAMGLVACLIAKEPVSWWPVAVEVPAALIVGLTGPFSILFTPLFAVRWCVRRTRYSAVLLALVALCGGLQLLFLSPDRAEGVFDPLNAWWLGLFGNAVSGLMLLGTKYATAVPNSGLLAATTLLLYVLLTWHAIRHRNLAQALILGAGFMLLLAVGYSYRGRPDLLSVNGGNIGCRYTYPIVVSLLWSLICVLSTPRLPARAAGVFLVVSAVASATSFQAVPMNNLHWRSASRAIGGQEMARVPINPPGWFIHYSPYRDPRHAR